LHLPGKQIAACGAVNAIGARVVQKAIDQAASARERGTRAHSYTPRAAPCLRRYCGNHAARTVAQCEVTGKWFCNGAVAPGGTCIVQHLVRGRYKELRLHPDSPLGATVLECYHSGSRNVFALGFVPVKADDTMVLLARDTPASAACVKDLDLDLSCWEPIIQVRARTCVRRTRACGCQTAVRRACDLKCPWPDIHCWPSIALAPMGVSSVESARHSPQKPNHAWTISASGL
jgi:RNA helicase (UPF2 interacting domain)